MKKLAIAAIALSAVVGTARADSILVLNSEEASYSILSRSMRTELARLPVGREPHHLIISPDGKDVLIGSTATNELLVLDSKTGERRRVVRDIIDPYHLGFSPNGKWFVTVAYRLDHVDIFHADGFKLAGRIFIDGLPSHMAFDAASNTVFITLQQSGRLAAFDLATQTVKWNVPVGNTPAGVIMLPDDKRLLVALTGEDGIVVIDAKDGQQIGRLQTGKGAHNFWPKGDGRHWFLSNRVEGTVSMLDTQDMKVAGTIKVQGGPDCMDITADGKELWVTQRFLRRVAVVDIEQLKVVASIPVGKSPHGVFMLKSPPAAPGSPLSPASGPLRSVSTGSGTTR
ncbi:MAG: PQQ-binding-like beta-propeller repeat protein [Rhodospirillales bacterium]|nr:PQQ-binding-like beta-propeller repeat protein [Rhodospirillales bacterium]